MLEAAHEATKSTMSQPMGAVIVKNGRVITGGFNVDADTRVGGVSLRAHAECNAFRRLHQRFERPLYWQKRGRVCGEDISRRYLDDGQAMPSLPAYDAQVSC